MEKTADGVPAQEEEQVSHPESFWMSGIVLEFGLLGVGAVPGVGAAAEPGADAVCPPHPASAAKGAAKLKTTRLGRNRFFNFSIVGNSFRSGEDYVKDVCAVYRKPE
jgi:hypothetical protein